MKDFIGGIEPIVWIDQDNEPPIDPEPEIPENVVTHNGEPVAHNGEYVTHG